MQPQSAIAIFDIVQSVGDTRAVPLIEEGVVSGSTDDTTDNRSEDRHNEIIVGRGKDFSTIDESREQSRTEISRGVDSL